LPKHLKKGKSEVQVPTDIPKMRFASFYPHCFSIFEKARKTAKKEENPRFSRVFFFFRRFSRFFKNQKTMRIKRCKTHLRGVGGDLNLRLPFFEVFWQLYFKISRNFF
jgi:hypothetical protein